LFSATSYKYYQSISIELAHISCHATFFQLTPGCAMHEGIKNMVGVTIQ